jgi:hypothetical protein
MYGCQEQIYAIFFLQVENGQLLLSGTFWGRENFEGFIAGEQLMQKKSKVANTFLCR